MRAKSVWSICLLTILTFSASAVPRESVRQELISLQNQNGLTLAAFFRSIQIVNFSQRSAPESAELLPLGTAGAGTFTRDGTLISIELTHVREVPRRKMSLGVVQADGAGLKDYSPVTSDGEMCWSYDDSAIVTGDLEIIGVGEDPNSVRNIAHAPGSRATVSSQCWSPDGNHIVYGLEIGGHSTEGGPDVKGNQTVEVYDISHKLSRELAKGFDPSWSPDGNWIAFLDDDNYYAVHPSGEGRKFLFHKKKAESGLLWSPDSRIVAYMSHCVGFEGPWGVWDVGWMRLRVRRLSDNSEDWVAEIADSFSPRWQWVTSPELVKQVKSSRSR